VIHNRKKVISLEIETNKLGNLVTGMYLMSLHYEITGTYAFK
jgi:hypothetical protein